MQYTYDELDRVSEICYTTSAIDNENEIVEHRYIYTYTASGAIHSVECTESGRKYQYNYNSRGQLTGYTELTASGNAYTDLAQSFFWYDDLNRLEYTQTSFRYAVGATNYLSDADYYDAVGYWYTYDNSASGNSAAGGAGTDVGALTQLEVSDGGLNTGATISYGYDSLYRLTTRTTTANGSAGFSQTVNYGYRQVSAGRTSGQVSSYQSTIGDTTTRYTYTYDSSGNITRITDQSGNVTRYTYDKLGQLTREDNPYLGKTYVYTYNEAGNRTSKTTYDYTTGTLGSETATKEYEYTGDQLSGTTYDAIGNPDTYNGYSLTWNGRQLMKMSMNNGQFEYRFTYNDEGIRTSKTSSGTTHTYALNGSQIVSEQFGTHFLVYLYDENGAPIGLQYRNKTYEKYDFDTYYFEKNLQGDIIAIYTEAGTKIGSYTYDAWGNCTPLPESGATTPQKQIVRMFNPFRYRGYYYDYDTGLYYLQSRYYNPATGRFINADGYVSTGTGLLGYNMYAYCGNNPVMNLDYNGDFWLPFNKLLYPGEIHQQVLNHICQEYGFTKEENVQNALLRIDLVNRNSADGIPEAYEVKPVTYRRDYMLLQAVWQLDNYIVKSGFNYKPGTDLVGGSFRYKDFLVSYWSEGQGIILYAFMYMPEQQEVSNIGVVPAGIPKRASHPELNTDSGRAVAMVGISVALCLVAMTGFASGGLGLERVSYGY